MRHTNPSQEIASTEYFVVGSSGLAFFSEKRISSISDRLGHTQFRDHIETLATVISARMDRSCDPFGSMITFSGPSTVLHVSIDCAKSYISGKKGDDIFRVF